MKDTNYANGLMLGVFLFLGLLGLGYILSNTAMTIKDYERSVTVKGLSEREYKADIVIWAIQFSVANNALKNLYSSLETATRQMKEFLEEHNMGAHEISVSSPAITDKSAQRYGNTAAPAFRYSAIQTVTV